MIRVVLSGGIGNQLFQYAAGRALALARDTDLIVDRPTAKPTTVRRERIFSNFQLAAKEAALLPSIYRKWAIKHHHSALLKETIFYEPGYEFCDRFFDLPDETALFGFFQNEKYFQPVAEQIRADLAFQPHLLAGKVKDLTNSIRQENAVSVHVRRGDYLKIEPFNVCTKNYYFNAIELYRSQLSNPKFYFFSDDIEWCFKTFQAKDFAICDRPKAQHSAATDLMLMSNCRHSIIANSSFSWWGAWLNNCADKLVAAPYRWLNGEIDPVDDIICKGWLKIDF